MPDGVRGLCWPHRAALTSWIVLDARGQAGRSLGGREKASAGRSFSKGCGEGQGLSFGRRDLAFER